ncbi:MAG TPA: hypothetical protein VND96_07165 [Candidatus Micrarchaeaceae archaeon]|nr:hypothetical protein [Candidatus Micrarchaeaceae archaeon]
MSDDAHDVPRTTPTHRLSLYKLESQLDLDFGELPIASAPDWESLPQASREEAMTALARLLAKAGMPEDESGV